MSRGDNDTNSGFSTAMFSKIGSASSGGVDNTPFPSATVLGGSRAIALPPADASDNGSMSRGDNDTNSGFSTAMFSKIGSASSGGVDNPPFPSATVLGGSRAIALPPADDSDNGSM